MTDHIATDVIGRYARGDAPIGADALCAVEAHLETCAVCREVVAERVAHLPETASLLARVGAQLAHLEHVPQMPAVRFPRRVGRWAPPGLWPRLAMTLLVIAAAVGLDLTGDSTLPTSLVLLVAPVAPLLGVAAVWSAGVDPAHELVVASPRAGLALVLRRTLAVLVVVIPALTVAGWLSGATPARWLLPSLAFTAGALALGEIVGLRLAAGVLATLWTAAVIAPTVVAARAPVARARPRPVVGRARRRHRHHARAAAGRLRVLRSARWFAR
jgi:hypothetical protein